MITINEIKDNQYKQCIHCKTKNIESKYYIIEITNNKLGTQISLCDTCIKELKEQLKNIK